MISQYNITPKGENLVYMSMFFPTDKDFYPEVEKAEVDHYYKGFFYFNSLNRFTQAKGQCLISKG